MYGTIARMQVMPGQEDAFLALAERWRQERKPDATGLIANHALKSERVPGEWIVLTVFDTEENYLQNAADPEQHRHYEAMRALLTSDPKWNDGHVFVIEPASVLV